MAQIKQSFCLGLYRKKDDPIEPIIRRAKELGYAAVEIWNRDREPFEELLEVCSRHGLPIASMSGHKSLTSGLNDPANHDRIEQELSESIELAARHGIAGLIVFSGNRQGRDDERSIGVCAAGLKRVVGLAEAKGVNLNLELLNSKRTHPDYQCDHTAWGVMVCQAVGSPRAKLLYDIFHMQIMEGDLIETIRANIAHIGHFHTGGVPGRGPLDERQEINYPAVLRAIAASGYDLYVGHEFGFQGDPLAMLETTFRACDV